MAFQGVDFYLMDDLLTSEERMIRDTVRKFVDNEVLPIIDDCFDEQRFPFDLVPKMAELGLLGPMVDPKYGGAGASYVTYGLMMMELERGDSGIRSFSSVQSSLVMYPIEAFGSEEQKMKWLPKMAKGEAIGCFGLTEPDFGSNPGGMVTRAKKDGDSWILNGAKMWITNGTIADVAIVWAKTDEGIRGFLVEKGTPGFSAPEIKKKMSLRASITSELIFEDCRIPSENMLPGSNVGIKATLMCLNKARYGIAWGGIGAAMACYDASVNYAKERVQFSKPIAAYQLVQGKLTWMLTEITKGQLLALQCGRLFEQGKGKHFHVSMAKMNNVSVALQIARVARDIHGANGITLEYAPIRHMNNLESVNTYEGTEDIHKLIIGKEITGFAAFD
jgi:glutaryl-CoA dehydrogenase